MNNAIDLLKEAFDLLRSGTWDGKELPEVDEDDKIVIEELILVLKEMIKD